jgi:hypothetical protein
LDEGSARRSLRIVDIDAEHPYISINFGLALKRQERLRMATRRKKAAKKRGTKRKATKRKGAKKKGAKRKAKRKAAKKAGGRKGRRRKKAAPEGM